MACENPLAKWSVEDLEEYLFDQGISDDVVRNFQMYMFTQVTVVGVVLHRVSMTKPHSKKRFASIGLLSVCSCTS